MQSPLVHDEMGKNRKMIPQTEFMYNRINKCSLYARSSSSAHVHVRAFLGGEEADDKKWLQYNHISVCVIASLHNRLLLTACNLYTSDWTESVR